MFDAISYVQMLLERTRVLIAMRDWRAEDFQAGFDPLREFVDEATSLRTAPPKKIKRKGTNTTAKQSRAPEAISAGWSLDDTKRLLRNIRNAAGGPEADLNFPLVSPMYQCAPISPPSSSMTVRDSVDGCTW